MDKVTTGRKTLAVRRKYAAMLNGIELALRNEAPEDLRVTKQAIIEACILVAHGNGALFSEVQKFIYKKLV